MLTNYGGVECCRTLNFVVNFTLKYSFDNLHCWLEILNKCSCSYSNVIWVFTVLLKNIRN